MTVADRYTIRLAQPADAPLIARHRTMMFLEARGWPEERGADLLAALPPVLATMLADGSYRGWLVTLPDGQVIAGAGAQIRSLIPRLEVLAGPEALIVNVYVEPAQRRQGLARWLMEAILVWCADQQIGRIVLHPTAAARPLYEALGFRTSGELILYGPSARKLAD